MLPELISSNFVNMINLSPTDCFFISSIISETLFFLTSTTSLFSRSEYFSLNAKKFSSLDIFLAFDNRY